MGTTRHRSGWLVPTRSSGSPLTARSIGTWFKDVRFHARAKFTRATFHYASFHRAQFRNADFTNTRFTEDAEFIQVSFAREALFKAARFYQAALFSSATFVRVATFEGVVFSQRADFHDADIQLTGKFKGVRFDGPTRLPQDRLDFMGASFGADVDRRDIKLPSTWVRAGETTPAGRYPVVTA